LTAAVGRTENRDMAALAPARRSRALDGLVLVALLGWAGWLAMPPAAAQGRRPGRGLAHSAVEALAAGKLLVAARRLPDSNFANAVILLADFNGKGAVGLILNRRSDVTIARVFPQLTPALGSGGQAFLGGPVERTRPMALVRAAQSPAGARHVFDGVYLLTEREAVEAAVTSNASPGRLRIYLGYAGWDAGQLEAETEEGVWHVLAGDAEAVFDPDPSSTWQRQIARTELIQARAGPPAIDRWSLPSPAGQW
jgi:putative transcriptional regulator